VQAVDGWDAGFVERIPLVEGDRRVAADCVLELPRRHFLRRRHPAVAGAQQADEERTTAFDLVQTDLERTLTLRLLFRHAPSQVEPDEFGAAPLTTAAQLGKNLAAQVIPLGVHVTKCR
jgi:hypothetical protein